jgi:aspartate kinase
MTQPRVLKFGGSSVADAACMRQVASVVKGALDRSPVVVLSAMGKTTDALFRMASAAKKGDLDAALAECGTLLGKHDAALADLCKGRPPADARNGMAALRLELESMLRGVGLLRELSPRSMDAIASIGERLSPQVFAAFTASDGVPTTLVDAREVIRTDGTFGTGAPQPEAIRRLAAEKVRPHLGPGKLVVTQGYIGSTEDGATTTLGRGGSDYSAALFGAALGVDDIQIWTDVEGVLTSDPRVVPAAKPIPRLSFAEAAELAAFGAKVLHPATVQPAIDAGIPVTVRHTMRPAGMFTTITAEAASTGRAVTALAHRAPITVLTVRSSRMLAQAGFLARLFEVFGRLGVSVDLVATAEVSVSLTVDQGAPLAPILAELRRFAQVDVSEGRAIVAVLGERLKRTAGLGAQVFAALGDINVEMISHGASEINLSLVVKAEDAVPAVQRLHKAFIEGRD